MKVLVYHLYFVWLSSCSYIADLEMPFECTTRQQESDSLTVASYLWLANVI